GAWSSTRLEPPHPPSSPPEARRLSRVGRPPISSTAGISCTAISRSIRRFRVTSVLARFQTPCVRHRYRCPRDRAPTAKPDRGSWHAEIGRLVRREGGGPRWPPSSVSALVIRFREPTRAVGVRLAEPCTAPSDEVAHVRRAPHEFVGLAQDQPPSTAQ